MIDRIGVIYTKNETKLSWLIWPDVVCYENQYRQQRH